MKVKSVISCFCDCATEPGGIIYESVRGKACILIPERQWTMRE